MAAIGPVFLSNKCLQVGNEEVVRTLGFGSNWTRIRLLCRIQINTVNVPSTQFQLLMGVCKGTTNTFYSDNCTSFLGAGPCSFGYPGGWGTDAANYLHIGGGGYTGGFAIKKTGGAVTKTPGGSPAGYVALASALNPTCFGVDITKTYYGTYSIYHLMPTADQFSTIITPYSFYRALEDYNGSYSLFTQVSAVAAVGLSDQMDTLSFSCNTSIPTVELTELAVIRFA